MQAWDVPWSWFVVSWLQDISHQTFLGYKNSNGFGVSKNRLFFAEIQRVPYCGWRQKCFSNKPWANPPSNHLLPAMQMRSPWKRTQANKERKKPKPTILGRPVIPCAVPSKSEKWMIDDDCLSKCSCFFCSFDELTIDRTSSRITTSVPFPQSELCFEYFILTDPWTKNLLHRQGTSSSNKSLEAKSELPGVGFNNFFKTKRANVKDWKLKLYQYLKKVIHSK